MKKTLLWRPLPPRSLLGKGEAVKLPNVVEIAATLKGRPPRLMVDIGRRMVSPTNSPFLISGGGLLTRTM